MSWLQFIIITVLADVFLLYLNNYISDVYFKDRHVVAQRLFYGIFYAIVGVVLALIFGIDFSAAPPATFLLFLLSGLITTIAGLPYYKALEYDNSINVGLCIQLSPVFYLILDWLLFGEHISPLQVLASLFILVAPILIITTSKKQSRSNRSKAIFLSFLFVLLEVIGNLIFLNTNTENLNFASELALVFLGHGVGNIVLILSVPKWRRRFFDVVKKSKKKVFRPMFIDSVLDVIKTFSYRSALVLAPSAALASVASDSVKPAVIFFLGIVLTLIWPKFGREKLDKKSVFTHLLATISVIIGIILLNISAF